MTRLDRVVLWISQGLGLGRIPRAPGTFGTLGGLALAYGLKWGCPCQWCYVIATLVICIVGVIACHRATVLLRSKDPQSVVLDEIAAIVLVFVGVPWSLRNAVLGFLLFRFLDITKPWPIRHVERLPGGWGVMFDDLAAGAVTALVLMAVQGQWPS